MKQKSILSRIIMKLHKCGKNARLRSVTRHRVGDHDMIVSAKYDCTICGKDVSYFDVEGVIE